MTSYQAALSQELIRFRAITRSPNQQITSTGNKAAKGETKKWVSKRKMDNEQLHTTVVQVILICSQVNSKRIIWNISSGLVSLKEKDNEVNSKLWTFVTNRTTSLKTSKERNNSNTLFHHIIYHWSNMKNSRIEIIDTAIMFASENALCVSFTIVSGCFMTYFILKPILQERRDRKRTIELKHDSDRTAQLQEKMKHIR